MLSITILEEEHQARVEAYKHNMHGRILWPKGSKLLLVQDLRTKLGLHWKELGKFGIISLGKGLFEFTFSSLEDVRRVRSSGSWNLSPGLLKLFPWSKDFIPSLQQNNMTQVCVCFYGRPRNIGALRSYLLMQAV